MAPNPLCIPHRSISPPTLSPRTANSPFEPEEPAELERFLAPPIPGSPSLLHPFTSLPTGGLEETKSPTNVTIYPPVHSAPFVPELQPDSTCLTSQWISMEENPPCFGA